MKKILIAILVLLVLTGCATPETETADKTETETVSIYKGGYMDLLDEETTEELYNIDVNLADNEMKLIGTELPEVEFTTYEGAVTELPDGPYILEIVGSWCSYCQALTAESIKELTNAGYTVYQYFLYGTATDVDSFYETIGMEKPDGVTILLANSDFEDYLYDNEIESIPFTVFVNADNKISLTHLGYSEAESMLEIAGYAMKNKLYETKMEDGSTLDEYIRKQAIIADYIENLEEIDIPSELLK